MENNREIRVFLSSTFLDMDAERDYLLKFVFPRIRQQCAQRGVGFTEIDLRWGITEAASKNGMTIEICLSEIERCRDYPPFFIGFLGERYGWAPKQSDLQAYWQQHGETRYSARIHDALEQAISVTELEMRFGVLDRSDSAVFDNAAFFLRDSALSNTLAAAVPPAQGLDFFDDGGGKLAALKNDLRASGRVEIDGYQHIAEFGERVYDLLFQGLDARYPVGDVPTPADTNAQTHARYAVFRRQGYVPVTAVREIVRAEVAQQLGAENAPRRLLYLTGPSGSGKSAFLANLAQWLPSQFSNAFIYDRYCGADNGQDINFWCDLLLEKISLGASVHHRRFANDNIRWKSLMQALEDMPRRDPVIILIDAIDRLDQPEHALRVLAAQPWPAGIVVIVSGLPREAQEGSYTDVPLAPLSIDLCKDIIGAFTGNYRKALPEHLIAHLANAVVDKPVLFLRMVLEDLRVHSKNDTLHYDLDRILDCMTAETLFSHFLERWDRDYAAPGHPALASELVALLAASREGLDEVELADLLAIGADPVSTETMAPRLPSLLLQPALLALRPYLMRNDGRETLMHDALVRAVPLPQIAQMRRRIAAYFSFPTPRAVAERIFQQMHLAAGQAEHRADGALYLALSPLDDILMLRARDRVVVRDALGLLGGRAATDDGLAARLGDAWAGQLDGTCSATKASQANAWLLALLDWAYRSCALPLARQLLAVRRRTSAQAPAELAVSLSNLGMLYLHLGNQQDAEILLVEALALNRAANDTDIVFNLRNLSSLYLAQGRLAEAELLAKESLVFRRRFLANKAREFATDLQNLGVICIHQGQLAQACAYIEEARDVLVGALPAGHEAMAACLNNLGEVYRRLDEPEKAYGALKEALAIRRDCLPAGHPQIAGVLNNMGALCQQYRQWDQAMQLFTEAFEILSVALPGMHPDIASCLNNLASVCNALEAFDDAEVLYTKALEITREVVPAGHPDLAGSLNNLGVLYLRQRRCDEAEPLLLEAFEILRAALPTGHPATATCYETLTALYRTTGDTAKLRRLQSPSAPVPPPPVAEALDTSSSFSESMTRMCTKMADMMFNRAPAGSTGDQLDGAHGEFGLVASNPVPCRGIADYHAYFRALRTADGRAVHYVRIGSVNNAVSASPIDVYEVSDGNGTSLAKLFLSAYARRTSRKAPTGFVLDAA